MESLDCGVEILWSFHTFLASKMSNPWPGPTAINHNLIFITMRKCHSCRSVYFKTLGTCPLWFSSEFVNASILHWLVFCLTFFSFQTSMNLLFVVFWVDTPSCHIHFNIFVKILFANVDFTHVVPHFPQRKLLNWTLYLVPSGFLKLQQYAINTFNITISDFT